MPKQLTVHNATITTAAVEVKTLTISGKQVTLAVFRQLREEPLIARDGTLNGVPWGVVNYHPDKCEGSRLAHRHYVWQRGEELLRARINDVPDFDKGGDLYRDGEALTFAPQTGNQFLTAAVSEWLLGQRDRLLLAERGKPNVLSPVEYSDTAYLRESALNFSLRATANPVAMDALKHKLRLDMALEEKPAEGSYPWVPEHNERIAQRQQHCQEAYDAASAALEDLTAGWPTAKELELTFLAEGLAEAERRQRHRDVRAALAELPQLFIAV